MNSSENSDLVPPLSVVTNTVTYPRSLTSQTSVLSLCQATRGRWEGKGVQDLGISQKEGKTSEDGLSPEIRDVPVRAVGREPAGRVRAGRGKGAGGGHRREGPG